MKKVLIVEDDRALVKAYQAMLTQEGFKVVHAYDGAEGLVKMRAESPDVVLLDLLMPNMNGEQMLTAVVAEGGAIARIPVIVLSNFGQGPDIARVSALGAKECLMKSDMSLAQVIEVVRRYAG